MAGRFTHILVPTDFNPASDAALACAKELAARFDARLTLLHAVNDPLVTGVWTPDVYVPADPGDAGQVPADREGASRRRVDR